LITNEAREDVLALFQLNAECGAVSFLTASQINAAYDLSAGAVKGCQSVLEQARGEHMTVGNQILLTKFVSSGLVVVSDRLRFGHGGY
jgi:hypothetical protein